MTPPAIVPLLPMVEIEPALLSAVTSARMIPLLFNAPITPWFKMLVSAALIVPAAAFASAVIRASRLLAMAMPLGDPPIVPALAMPARLPRLLIAKSLPLIAPLLVKVVIAPSL